MRDGDCPQTSAKIRLSVAIYNPGCWVPLAATTRTRTGVSEEGRAGIQQLLGLAEADLGLLINSGDVGHTRKC